MIEAIGLTKTFTDKKRGEIHAAQDVSFRANPGQIYGLLGANGAGKTTTLRMLATLLQPTRGSATVAGFDVVRDSARVRANVGFLAASTALYGRLTARETIAYFGRLNGLNGAQIKARTQTLADELDMHDFLDRRCEKFSTGMKQKTSIARTLVHDPAVMIFDEPTLGLAPKIIDQIAELLARIRAEGTTLLLVEQNAGVALDLADYAYVFSSGELAIEGAAAALKSDDRVRRLYLGESIDDEPTAPAEESI